MIMGKTAAAVWVNDPWGNDGGWFADMAYEQDVPKLSKLLGQDGLPLAYKKQKMGFDLTPRDKIK